MEIRRAWAVGAPPNKMHKKNPRVALPGVSALLSMRGAQPHGLLSRTALDTGMGSIGSTPQEP